jgi:lipoate-protein ligase A
VQYGASDISRERADAVSDAQRWRLLETWACRPEVAMGLDEVLLASAAARPTLRLYTWEPAALSLGYFQRFEDVPAARAVSHVVRRVTGGGAIHHHAGELTFSITALATDMLYRGEVAASYARVHAVLIEALAAAGLVGAHAPKLAESRGALSSDRAGTGMCFHTSTPLDVVWDGRKGIGSAQRRTGGRVLHHGSIKLASSPHEPEIATVADAGVRTTPLRNMRARSDT